MERKIPFELNEKYHLYTRGVEKRRIFMSESDHERFLALLLHCNGRKGVETRRRRGFPSVSSPETGERLIDVIAYALMPNHVHLLVRQTQPDGISKFMLKLLTAYSMYFNTKYERSGPLFTRPFRSKHIDSDEYLRWAFSYVTVNPLDIHQPGWKEHGLRSHADAAAFMQRYRYSSFFDYFVSPRPESTIISQPQDQHFSLPAGFDELLNALAQETSLKPSATEAQNNSLVYFT